MKQKIIRILSEIRPEFDFKAASSFIEQGMLDSLDIVTLVADLDKEFCISIDGLDILPDNFSSVEAIERLLLKNGAKQ